MMRITGMFAPDGDNKRPKVKPAPALALFKRAADLAGTPTHITTDAAGQFVAPHRNLAWPGRVLQQLRRSAGERRRWKACLLYRALCLLCCYTRLRKASRMRASATTRAR